ncbi:MAG: hypothetical protein Q7R43_01010 [Candidatus Daviesbacteria bacterium]|nr:hypothetical protein [Candidatus Daviesbacteria bacterium]
MKNIYILIFYWSLLLIIFFLQFIFTQNSLSQIRYEELAESVRNVFWLQNKTVYDGISSNIGWYGTLLILYNFFGFDINSAKYFRLFLQLISLFCLSLVLKKYLGEKLAIIPLIAIGLSPTFLFFNTLQTSYGLDIQYLFIVIYLLTTLDYKNVGVCYFKQILLWGLIMIAWMSYPIFIFYIPSLGIFYLWNLWKKFKTKKEKIILNCLLSFFAFITPLAVGFLYVKDKQLLFYDSITKSGIFRGAGTLQISLNLFWINFTGLLGDLFTKADSYYFDISSTDFSNFYPIISVLFILTISILLSIKNKSYRFPMLLIWTVIIFDLIISTLTVDPSGKPGIRRHSAFLISIYALYTITWYFINHIKFTTSAQSIKWIIIIIFLFIPLHNFLAFFNNFENLSNPSIYKYPINFDLNLIIKNIKQEEFKVACQNENGNLVTCRYSEIYPAVAGYCLWNNIRCKSILGYDDKRKEYIPLSIDLWEKYYWIH